MKLTIRNYFTFRNSYLSSSKLKDYLIDPWYFYRKHVVGLIPKETTPSMILGSAVDLYLTGSRNHYHKKYEQKVLKRDNPELYELQNSEGYKKTLLSPNDYSRVKEMVNAIEITDVYKQIHHGGFKAQYVLQINSKIGKFPGIGGIPDWFKVDDNKHATIIDLKTTSNIDKFYYTARDLQYHFQQAVYQNLVAHNFGAETFQSYILAVENNEPYRVGFFLLDQDVINDKKFLLDDILGQIAKRKKPTDWNQKNIGWENAVVI
jgi:hypothetical protein